MTIKTKENLTSVLLNSIKVVGQEINISKNLYYKKAPTSANFSFFSNFKVIGKIGRVEKIHPTGNVVVHYDKSLTDDAPRHIRMFAKLIEEEWAFNPLCLRKVSSSATNILVLSLCEISFRYYILFISFVQLQAKLQAIVSRFPLGGIFRSE